MKFERELEKAYKQVRWNSKNSDEPSKRILRRFRCEFEENVKGTFQKDLRGILWGYKKDENNSNVRCF